jgi:hypothetical protein
MQGCVFEQNCIDIVDGSYCHLHKTAIRKDENFPALDAIVSNINLDCRE